MYNWFIHWNADEVIFSIGPVSLRWYSLMFALGFMIGYRMMRSFFVREGENTDLLDSLLIYLIMGTIIGARLGHCIFYDWAYYKDHILEMLLPVSFDPSFHFTGYRGLASHGGAIGILISLWFFSRKYRKSMLWVLDRVVIPVALTGAFIRFGNLMNSEIVGKQTDVPWAFIFEKLDQVPRHPTQLYESISYVISFAVLFWMYWKTDMRLKRGALFGWFLIFIWSARFFLEYFKRSQGGIQEYFGNVLSTGQILSIPFIIAGILFVLKAKRVDPARK